VLSETVVSVLLEASITGAGLVLAVYALIIPLTRKFFGYRTEAMYAEIEKVRGKLGARADFSEKDFASSDFLTIDLDELRESIDRIEEEQRIPTYLKWGAGVVFFGYMASTLLSYAWLVNWEQQGMDFWLSIAFVVSTILFLFMGLSAIKDINQTIEKELEELKKLRRPKSATEEKPK
jgi:hypothetical protein